MHYHVNHTGLHTFFRLQVPLTPARRIPAGQHVFPFIFTLPASLPTSFCYQSSGSLKCVGVLGRVGLCVLEPSGPKTTRRQCALQMQLLSCPLPPTLHYPTHPLAQPPSHPPNHPCLLRHCRAEIIYKVKAVCGLEGMLTPNLRHTQRVDIASQPQASLPQQCSVVSEPPWSQA